MGKVDADVMDSQQLVPSVPSPSSAKVVQPGRGFDLWDYACCGLYMVLTLYISGRSAFRKQTLEQKVNRHSKPESGAVTLLSDGPTSSSFQQHNTREEAPLRNNEAANDYFLAGRSANNTVVAISLVSGLTSGISFIGTPAYAYSNGAGVLTIAASQVVGGRCTFSLYFIVQ